MSNEPSFERLCEIIREQCQLHPDERIKQETQFERDRGITGDDGDDVLGAVAKAFKIEFDAKLFDLQPNEYLFNSEGMDLFGVLWRSIRRRPEPEVRSFTVGELYLAVQKELAKR